MQIQEPSNKQQPLPLWRLAFRPGFLAAGLFAIFAVARWLAIVSGTITWHGAVSPHWWHAHEMIFGFAMPVVAGFLLSAVATWTGLPGSRGTVLQVIFGLWLLARAVLCLAPDLLWLAWLAESGFLAITTLELGRRVWARRQWRNLIFVPVLIILWLLCSASYLLAFEPQISKQLHYGALWMIILLIAIIGGRVIPLFTANRLQLSISPLPLWFTALACSLIVVIALLSVLGWSEHSAVFKSIAACAAVVHLYRLWHWQCRKTLKVPLLWSLQLSYLCIPLSLILLTLGPSHASAVQNSAHLLAIGALGGMIMAMMSRVALGHTGRALQQPGHMAVAFALVPLAAGVRAGVPLLLPSYTLWGWLIAGAMWCLAFALFIYYYAPILCGPRADGKPG